MIAFVFHVSLANAQVPTCEINSSVANKTGENSYRISFAGIDQVGLTEMEWKYQVLNAAEVWNSKANSAWFKFDGEAAVDSLPPGSCSADEQINLIRIGSKGDGICTKSTAGRFNTRCNSKQWSITLCASNDNGDVNWHIDGDYSSGGLDVMGVLVHEFGHAMGLDHPSAASAVMTSTVQSNLRDRSLYPWDIECPEREYGRRSQPINYFLQIHGSDSFYGPYLMGDGYTKGMGASRLNGSSLARYSVGYDYRFRNSGGNTVSSPIVNFNQQYVSAFSSAWFPELPDRWRTMYNYDYDSSNRYNNVLGRNNIYQFAYDHVFSASPTQGRMFGCVDAPPSCNSEAIYSHEAMSSVYDVVSGKTIFAWVNSNRQNDDEDRQVWISVGTRGSSERILNVPQKLELPGNISLRSATNVALSCGPSGSANGYNCIIVYTPLETGQFQLRVRRFFVSGASDNYSLVWDATTSGVGWLTGSDATSWYHNRAWWIAHTSGTNIQVRRSFDSVVWSHYTTLSDASIGPPRAVTTDAYGARTTRIYYTKR